MVLSFARWLQKWRVRATLPRPRRARIEVEALEERRTPSGTAATLALSSAGDLVFSAVPGIANKLTVQLSGNTYFLSDSSATAIQVSGTGAGNVGSAGATTATVPANAVQRITVDALGSGDAVNILSTAVPTLVTDSTGGSDSVTLGNQHDVSGFVGTVTVNSPAQASATTALTVDDSAGPSKSVIVNSGSVSGLTTGGVVFTGGRVNLTILGGGFVGSRYTINGANVPATIVGGSGNDSFQLGAGASLTGSIDGGPGTNTLDYSQYTTPVYVFITLQANGVAAGQATGLGLGFRRIAQVKANPANPATLLEAPFTPKISLTVATQGATYNGSPVVATVQLTAYDGTAQTSLEGVSPNVTYYAGSTASGTPLPGPPVGAGDFVVAAAFAGSADYSPASASLKFSIGKAGTTVSINAADGLVYNGGPQGATATVAAAGNGTAQASLEGVSPTVTYYAGNSAVGTPLSGPPVAAGTYTAIASFAGSADYAAADTRARPATFTIGKVGPTVTLTTPGGTYDGTPHGATAQVAGVDGVLQASLEGVSPTITYYAGVSATGTPLAGAPVAAGTFTAVASFPGSVNYGAADTRAMPATFVIARAAATVTVSVGPGADGSVVVATAQVAGIDGAAQDRLDGVSPTISFFAGTDISAPPLAGAPTTPGTYSVVASFRGSADYGPATTSPATFTIAAETPETSSFPSTTTTSTGSTASPSLTIAAPSQVQARSGMVSFRSQPITLTEAGRSRQVTVHLNTTRGQFQVQGAVARVHGKQTRNLTVTGNLTAVNRTLSNLALVLGKAHGAVRVRISASDGQLSQAATITVTA